MRKVRKVLVIRHAHSTANNYDAPVPTGKTVEELALENRKAEVTRSKGYAQASVVKSRLLSSYGPAITQAPIAISQFVRTFQTAKLLGFRGVLTPYAKLNEINPDIDKDELWDWLSRNEMPPQITDVAEALLRDPPAEHIWVSHGWLIGGICAVLGVIGNYKRAMPFQCEPRILTLPV